MSHLPGESTHQSNQAPARCPRIELDDIEWQYGFVKALSSSPLRDDLERCLADLDRLVQRAWSAQDPAGIVLALEMDDRRRQVLAALRSGREI